MMSQQEIESVPPCKVWNFRTQSFDVVTERYRQEYPRAESHIRTEKTGPLPGWLSYPSAEEKPVKEKSKPAIARQASEPKPKKVKPPKIAQPRKIRDPQSWQMSPARIANRRVFIVQILEAYESGKKQRDIANEMEMSQAAISQSVKKFCRLDQEIQGRWMALNTCKCGSSKLPARAACGECLWRKARTERRAERRAARKVQG